MWKASGGTRTLVNTSHNRIAHRPKPESNEQFRLRLFIVTKSFFKSRGESDETRFRSSFISRKEELPMLSVPTIVRQAYLGIRTPSAERYMAWRWGLKCDGAPTACFVLRWGRSLHPVRSCIRESCTILCVICLYIRLSLW